MKTVSDNIIDELMEMRLDKGGVCSVISVYDKEHSTYEVHVREACHMFTQQLLRRREVVGFYTALWPNCEECAAAATAYWYFLINPTYGPFRQIKEAFILDDDAGLPLAMYVPANINNKMMMNLLIATRTPYERYGKIMAFQKFLDEGFEASEAFYLMQHISFEHGGKFNLAMDHPHTPCLPQGNIDHKKIREGAPDADVNKLVYGKKNKGRWNGFTPMTAMWDKNSKEILENYPTGRICERIRTDQHPLYSLIDDSQDYTGVFRKEFHREHRGYKFARKGVLQGAALITKLRETHGEWAT